MTDDEQRQEARDLIRFFGATVEEIAEALGIDVELAAVLAAEVGPISPR